jgi:hypothetical protein
MSSTRKASEHPRLAYNLPEAVTAVTAATAATEAAAAATEAVEAVEAAGVAAAVEACGGGASVADGDIDRA